MITIQKEDIGDIFRRRDKRYTERRKREIDR